MAKRLRPERPALDRALIVYLATHMDRYTPVDLPKVIEGYERIPLLSLLHQAYLVELAKHNAAAELSGESEAKPRKKRDPKPKNGQRRRKFARIKKDKKK